MKYSNLSDTSDTFILRDIWATFTLSNTSDTIILSDVWDTFS